MVAFVGVGFLVQATLPKSVELTIYNGNFGLVKEVRTLHLRSGRQEARLEDVPSQIDPTSVGIRSITPGFSFEALEQNYQYDLISPQAILAKSVGKRVRFSERLENGQLIVTEGELLSSDRVILRTDEGRIVIEPAGTIEVAEMPEGLISKPTLMWDLQSANSGDCDVEVAYLTSQINWNADYVLTLNQDDSRADLNGWVTIDNRSGATFDNAMLKLVAGEVRRIQPEYRTGALGAPRDANESILADKMGFQEQQLFEYHLYTLQRPATVRNNEIKQIALLTASGAGVKKELVFEGQRSLWTSYGNTYRPGSGTATDENRKVNVMIELLNSEKNKLGMPLPKGRIRVYKRDASGQVQMLGEDEIDHTPREEKVRLYVGDAFDIVGQRKRTSYTVVSPRHVRESFQITLRNRKRVAESVRVVEHAWADWAILNSSEKSTKTDSNTFEFLVRLAPDQEKTITYSIETKW